jgi:ubiquinone/menaquinone biosynthesis C-methylase UbiE
MKNIGKCYLCGTGEDRFEFLFSGQDRLYGIKGAFKIFRCINCGLVFVNPQLSREEMTEFYPKGKYYSYSEIINKKKPIYQKILYYLIRFHKFVFVLLSKPLSRSIPVIKHGKILDIGCGNGEFLLRFSKSTSVGLYGVEIYSIKNDLKDKIHFSKGSLIDAEYRNNVFDIITLNHTLEHLDNPDKVFVELKRILKPGGKVIIAVPNITSLAYWIFKKNWVGLDIPRHLFSYSTKTLLRFAQKAGLKIKKIRYNSTPGQFLASFECFLNKYRKRQVLLTESKLYYNTILNLLFMPLAYLCNFLRIGDAIEVHLTK